LEVIEDDDGTRFGASVVAAAAAWTPLSLEAAVF
jgi:hypothetical protein